MPATAYRPLLVSLLVTALAGSASLLLPNRWAADAVGLLFFGATYWLVLRREGAFIRQHGLAMGGLLEPHPLDRRRLLRSVAVASAWALAASGVLFPGFFLGYQLYWQPTVEFEHTLPADVVALLATQLLTIALPEEMFYRGYLQSQLAQAWGRGPRVFGGSLGPDVWVTSIVFALGHVVTIPSPARLAVFFPSLVFGWLRSRTGGIGASVLFHALCNLLAVYLGRGYGFIP